MQGKQADKEAERIGEASSHGYVDITIVLSSHIWPYDTMTPALAKGGLRDPVSSRTTMDSSSSISAIGLPPLGGGGDGGGGGGGINSVYRPRQEYENEYTKQ